MTTVGTMAKTYDLSMPMMIKDRAFDILVLAKEQLAMVGLDN